MFGEIIERIKDINYDREVWKKRKEEDRRAKRYWRKIDHAPKFIEKYNILKRKMKKHDFIFKEDEWDGNYHSNNIYDSTIDGSENLVGTYNYIRIARHSDIDWEASYVDLKKKYIKLLILRKLRRLKEKLRKKKLV